jgi:hypothetical protein
MLHSDLIRRKKPQQLLFHLHAVWSQVLVLEDTFETLDHDFWIHELTAGGAHGANWEFQVANDICYFRHCPAAAKLTIYSMQFL